MLSLEILICTIDDGIVRAASVPCAPQEGVSYLISWQQSQPNQPQVPASLLERDDIRIVNLKGRGLSRNRNYALAHARGDILLISDDDTSYEPEYFSRIVKAFEERPEADIITFQMANPEGEITMPYQPKPYTYARRPRGSYICSCEIACRRQAALPQFDERFGLGPDYLASGEEDVFIHQAHLNGLQILYIPQVIVRTNTATTGTRFLTWDAVQRSKGAVLCFIHGYHSAWLRCLKIVLGLPGGTKRRAIFKEMLKGARYVRNS